MKDLVQLAIDTAKAKGATYADARGVEIWREDVATKNGALGQADFSESVGLGVRVIADGAWGFASTANLSRGGVEKAAALAVEIAKASATVTKEKVKLAPVEKVIARWETPILYDPFEISLEEKVGLLLSIDKVLRGVKGVKVAEGNFTFVRKKQEFASTEGSKIGQVITMSGVGYSATAVGGDDVQKRSYPTSFRGQFENRGYEIVDRWPLLENAQRIGEEAVALLSAPQCPQGKKDLILESSQLALQVHESCGHPIELDRVLGTEANFAGQSFLTLEKHKKFEYGSKKVHLTADATAPGGAGTFGYDDEGVPSRKWDIVKEGQFVGYLTSRETAGVIGLDQSQGTMRADGWNRIPIIRMVNVSLQPDKGSLGELISDTDDGIYMETNRSWSIDQRRYNFQFGTEIGWEIKKGKKTRMLKNPTYAGITPEFWRSCDAVCGRKEWVLWGIPNCGKGQPGQIMATGHGAAPARFRGVDIGVAYAD
ncbi:MAG: TldD/PmbA family protein [Planctomycetota bacterium]|nr:TldD/PmbA family protein [Planctomycetota bacterium]